MHDRDVTAPTLAPPSAAAPTDREAVLKLPGVVDTVENLFRRHRDESQHDQDDVVLAVAGSGLLVSINVVELIKHQCRTNELLGRVLAQLERINDTLEDEIEIPAEVPGEAVQT